MNNSGFSHEPKELDISTDLRFVDDAILLQNKVFNATEPSSYNSKDEWLKRINNGGYFVVVNEGGIIKGFAVCDVTSKGSFKIWLAGVDSEARGRGIWSKMYQAVADYAQEQGYQYILLNTFPKKFPIMFAFLQKMRAEIYKEETVDGFDKIYTRIKIR